MEWILGTLRKELLWLYLPGLCALVLSYFLIPPTAESAAFLIYAFFAKEFFDSGHVYTTLWRTYFHPRERKRDGMYLYIPLCLFVIFWAWGYFQFPYLGAFIVYATIFHNVRQFFGISKWYQRLNGVYRKASDAFLYFLCFTPFVAAHFRTDYVWNSYYSPQDVFRWPNQTIYAVIAGIYIAGLLGWLVYEARLLRSAREWNRLLSVAFPSLLYGVAFLFGHTASEIIFPLVVAHGVGYFALMSLALSRTQPRFASFIKAVAVVAVTALFFGVLEGYFEDEFLDLSSRTLAPLVALYLTPLFCHYYFDAFLWKGKHPEAKAIYSGYTRCTGISEPR